MTGEAPERGHAWVGRVATVAVPSLLTAAAFIVLSRFGLAGHLPLWALLGILTVAGVLGEFTGRFVRFDARLWSLHLAIAMQCLSVSAVIYAIGWGPTLAVGYLFVVARALDEAGARTWPVTLLWATVG